MATLLGSPGGGKLAGAVSAADGTTALHLAVEKGNSDIATLLARNGAPLDARAAKGFSPLHLALQLGQTEMARVLIGLGASVNVRRDDGYTPLLLAARYDPPEPSLVSALLQHGAEVDAATPDGMTALHHLARSRSAHVARLLLEHGASPDAVSSDYGFTPLRIVAEYGEAPTASLLLEHGASVGLRDRMGHTAAYVASHFGHGEVLELLRRHARGVEVGVSEGRGDIRDEGDDVSLKVSLAELSVDLTAPDAIERASRLWRRKGVVVFPSVLSREVVSALRRHVREELARPEDADTVDQSLNIRSARLRALRAIGVSATSATISQMATVLLPFLFAELGDEQHLLESCTFSTSPGADDQEFHADVTNYDPRLASVQITLVDTVESQGVLEVAPGTHLDPERWMESFDRDEPSRRPRTVAVAAPAGSVTFYSSSLVHRGRANTHGKERLVLGLTMLGDGGVVPSGLPYTLQPQDLGRWTLVKGSLTDGAAT